MLCPLLEHFSRVRRCREKGRKRGGQQGGKKEKRTRENKSDSNFQEDDLDQGGPNIFETIPSSWYQYEDLIRVHTPRGSCNDTRLLEGFLEGSLAVSAS